MCVCVYVCTSAVLFVVWFVDHPSLLPFVSLCFSGRIKDCVSSVQRQLFYWHVVKKVKNRVKACSHWHECSAWFEWKSDDVNSLIQRLLWSNPFVTEKKWQQHFFCICIIKYKRTGFELFLYYSPKAPILFTRLHSGVLVGLNRHNNSRSFTCLAMWSFVLSSLFTRAFSKFWNQQMNHFYSL